MRKLTYLGAAAILASSVAVPSLAQAAGCALYDPGCQTYQAYQMPSNGGTSGPTRTEIRADAGTNQRHYRTAYRTDRTVQRAAVNDRAHRNGYSGPGYDRPANVVGGAIGTAGAIARGAVNTTGAITTAPFRAGDSYAYYNNGYTGWHDGDWYGQSYAERNGFVCTPGTYFRGADRLIHVCQ